MLGSPGAGAASGPAHAQSLHRTFKQNARRFFTAHLYHPKLLTAISEGYGLADLRRDVVAGLTVAVVALPLSAIAVASGVTPERGLFTAIVGGLFVSALGGSRYQIGGPAGAFIVLVAATEPNSGLTGCS